MTLVSVVVPTYNRLSRLKQVLHALERQRFPLDQFEVIVVSDGSSDGTHEYLQSLDTALQLHFIAQANQGPAAARNQGIARAVGEIVLFVDDDVLPTPGLIAEHLRIHDEQADAVVLGPMLTPDDFHMSPWVAWEQAMLMKQYQAMERGDWEPSPRQFYTGNTSVVRSYLNKAGGFDARFRRAEDVELAWRLVQHGVHFVYNPRAIGYHYAERSLRSWLDTPYVYGRNDITFSRERESWLKDLIYWEFHKRNPMIRSLVRLCLDRPRSSRVVQQGLHQVGNLFYQFGAERLSRAAYSAIFNMRYYQGVADELGGRNELLNMIPEPDEDEVGDAQAV